MKVSILVAVYNAEKFLPKCLESLLGQTHRDLQIICIDDASTDGSWQLLQTYAAKDSRITILQQKENGGQAKARNRGLEISEGDYVMMVDSDDWLSPDAIEQACRVAEAYERADTVLLDVVYHDDRTGRQWSYAYRTTAVSFTGEEAFRLSLDWSIHGLYMVRRNIHLQVPYDDTSRSFSDDNTTRLHYFYSREVRRSSGLYYYRQHDASTTHRIDVSRFNYLAANWQMRQELLRLKADASILAFYEKSRWLNLVGMYVFYWENRASFSASEREDIHRLLARYYSTIQFSELPSSLTRKFGYSPCRGVFRLFQWQVFLYAHLRMLYFAIKKCFV